VVFLLRRRRRWSPNAAPRRTFSRPTQQGGCDGGPACAVLLDSPKPSREPSRTPLGS